MTSTTGTTSTTTTCPVTPVNPHPDAQLARDEVGHPLDIPEVTEKVFEQCVFNGDFRSIQTLACLSARMCNNIESFRERRVLMDTTDLQKRFPALRILDTNILPELQVYEKFPINLYALVKGLKELSPHVKRDAGVSLFIMRKGTTLNKIVNYANSGQTKEEKMKIVFSNRILTELGDDAVEETCVVLITNNVFKKSCRKTYSQQRDLARDEHQCELPSALGYIGLIVLTKKHYNQCLYGDLTCGRSSTIFEGFPLVVGNSSSSRFRVMSNLHQGAWDFGAGGWRKL